MSSSDTESDTPVKPKKRMRYEENYKVNKIKKSRLVNEPYYRNYKGRYVHANPHGFDCKCRHKCFEKVADEMCIEIYSKFVSFTTKNEQDAYLQNLIRVKTFTRQRKRDADFVPRKEKSTSFLYQVSTSSGTITVCKMAFLSLHGITGDRVCRLMIKVPKDMRGAGTAQCYSAMC